MKWKSWLLSTRKIVPPPVWFELCNASAPETVKAWMRSPPGWFRLQELKNATDTNTGLQDAGEREAIALALELGAGLLLMDDADGRKAALASGLEVRGTIGILTEGAIRNLLDLPAALERLSSTNFHLTQALKDRAIKAVQSRPTP